MMYMEMLLVSASFITRVLSMQLRYLQKKMQNLEIRIANMVSPWARGGRVLLGGDDEEGKEVGGATATHSA